MIGIELKNKQILLFTASRYISYSLLFVRGILIANVLGPYLFGIWGFLTLSLQYLTYTSLGIEYATTVELSTSGDIPSQDFDRIASGAVTASLIIAIILGLIGILLRVADISLIEKYDFSNYIFEIGIITGLTHLQQVFTNIYRVKKRLAKIAIIELVNAFVLLIIALTFNGEELINALLVGMIVSGLISLLIYLYKPPFKMSLVMDKEIIKNLLLVGVPLLIYNVSFFLIAVSARTILSIFYSVETMGYYTLANSITTATLLGLRSIVWVIFPIILSRTHSGIEDGEAKKTVDNITTLYSTSVFFVVFLLILILPILFLIVPEYQPAVNAVIFLLLAQAVLSASFGYNSVAIARRKQNQVAMISIFSVIVVIIFSLIVSYKQWAFEWVAVAVLFGSIVYTILQARLGSAILNTGKFGFTQIDSMVSVGTILALICFIVGTISNQIMVFGLLGLILFIYFNWEKLKYILSFALNRLGVQ